MQNTSKETLQNIMSLLYTGIITDNHDLFDNEHLEKIINMPVEIFKELGIKDKDYFRDDLLRVISEVISANVLLFDEPNYEWTKEFIISFFKNKKIQISNNSNDLKMLILSSLSLTTKEYLNFHLELYFSDYIDKYQMEELNNTVLDKSSLSILESVYYISKHQDSDFLKENVMMAGRVYSYALSALYSSLYKNDDRIKEYVNKTDYFLSKVEEYFLENYSNLLIKTNLIHEKIIGLK